MNQKTRYMPWPDGDQFFTLRERELTPEPPLPESGYLVPTQAEGVRIRFSGDTVSIYAYAELPCARVLQRLEDELNRLDFLNTWLKPRERCKVPDCIELDENDQLPQLVGCAITVQNQDTPHCPAVFANRRRHYPHIASIEAYSAHLKLEACLEKMTHVADIGREEVHSLIHRVHDLTADWSAQDKAYLRVALAYPGQWSAYEESLLMARRLKYHAASDDAAEPCPFAEAAAAGGAK